MEPLRPTPDQEALLEMGRELDRIEAAVAAGDHDLRTLGFWKMIQAEKTWPLVSISFVNDGRTALHPSGVVLETDGESPAGKGSLLDVFQRRITFLQVLPGPFLL